MIRAVLLVPEKGDPLDLLAAGACGSRPPVVWKHLGTWGRVRIRGWANDPALVLAWRGLPVVEGLDLLFRRGALSGGGWRPVDAGSPRDLANLARQVRNRAADLKLGTIVLVDADGQEVTP